MDTNYSFTGGYPTPETIAAAYDDADYSRAVQCYKYFFAAVSGRTIVRGNIAVGVKPNGPFGLMDATAAQEGLTLNCDTPYGPIMVDLSDSPFVVEIPPGPIMGVIMDIDQRWIADLGIPGPDGDKGGRFFVVPPGWTGDLPSEGYHFAHPNSYLVHVGVRAVPVGGDWDRARTLVHSVNVRPYGDTQSSTSTWVDVPAQDTSPNSVQGTFDYWIALDDIIQNQPPLAMHHPFYGELAALGMEKGKIFSPDQRLKAILTRAAHDADAQMRVQSLADRRPDRIAWPDRRWEWVTLRPDSAHFETENYIDTVAREVWFYQAIGTSPVMFRRAGGAGMAYWFGAHDVEGDYLRGENHYTLTIPQPVPAQLFWSVTVYDAQTRSQLVNEQGKVALRSLFELSEWKDEDSVELHFAPECPEGAQGRWIQTVPGHGWFTYLRIYGPAEEVFDDDWRPGDYVRVL